MRWALICTTALLIGFISGSFIAKPFFENHTLNKPAVIDIPTTATSTLPTEPGQESSTTTEAAPLASTSTPMNEIDFSVPITYTPDEKVTFPDGLMVTVTAIYDSRCKPDVQCIWAGELSPQLTLTGGNLGKSVILLSLGTTRTQTQDAGDYTILLGDTTPLTTTLTIKKSSAAPAVTSPVTPKPTTKASTAAPKATVAPQKTTTSFAVEVARLITEATKKIRTQEGLASFTPDTKLAASAKKYSAQLLAGNYLAHIDKSGCDLTCRFNESGYQASSWGENLAMMEYDEEPSAEYVANFFMTQWQKSAGHRKNLLSDTFTHQGIGVSVVNGKIYVAVHFALPR